MFDRLRLKITLGTAFILGGFLLLLGMYTMNSQKQQLIQNLEEHGSRVAALAARSSAEYIQRFSFFLMEDQALSIEQSPNIAFCEIYDAKGVSLLQSGNIISVDHTGKNRAEYGDNILVVTQPILAGGKSLGLVEIGMRLDGVNKAIAEKTTDLIILFLAFTLCVVVALNLFFHRLILKPVLSLADGTQKVANRDFVSIDVGSRKDEIGLLAHHFNTMSQNLQELYKNLEGKVLERTQALEQANNDLVVAMEKAQEMAAKAEAGTLAKSQFLASMSHEIRTPMNAVLGIGEILSGSELNDHQRLLVKTLLQSGNSLLGLIDDILDFSKIEAGEMVFESTPFNLEAIIDKTFKVTAYTGHKKGLDLDYSVASDVPLELMGDPHRLQQILINLIGNGIKFTDQGSVLLDVSLDSGKEVVSGDTSMLRFSIVDTGVGVRESKLQTIFDKFTQVDASTTRRHGGTGLGLSICKLLCENLGGCIWLESDFGVGTTASFVIPFRVLEENEGAHPVLGGCPIAVVDNRDYAPSTLVSRLQRCGAKVDHFNEPEDLNKVDVSQYKIILLGTPIEGGPEVWADENGIEQQRLILLTSSDNVGQYSTSPVVRTLTKPASISEVAEVVSNGITPAPLNGEMVLDIDSSGMDRLKILLAEDSENNSMLVEFYLKGLNHRLTIARNGEEALERLKHEFYDIVFMDVEMPIMDGIECTQKLREWERVSGKRPVRVIALTAHALNEIKDQALAAGCDAFLTKPIAKKALLRSLEEHHDAQRKKGDHSGH